MSDLIDSPDSPSSEADPGTVAVPERAELAEVVDGEVVEGVVVDEPLPVVPSVALVPVYVVRIVVQHEHTKTAGRHASPQRTVPMVPDTTAPNFGCGRRRRVGAPWLPKPGCVCTLRSATSTRRCSQ
jgi:hypothetical protein